MTTNDTRLDEKFLDIWLGMCRSWIIETELRNKFNLDLNVEFSISNFENFQMTASVMHNSTQTINAECIRIIMAGNTSMNQYISKVCLSSLPSAHGKKGHGPRIDFFINTKIYKNCH